MSVEQRQVTQYVAKCDACGRTLGASLRSRGLDWYFRSHDCQTHRRQFDSTGGLRGILARWRVSCTCGESWVADDSYAEFHCPKDKH